MTSNPPLDGATATEPQVVTGNTFTGGAGVTFHSDFLRNGGGGYTDISVTGNTITAAGITLRNGALDANAAHAAIQGAEVLENTLTGVGAARGVRVAGQVTDSFIRSNDITGYGIGVGVEHAASPGTHAGFDVVVEHNRIVGNTIGVANATSAPVHGEANWWGCNAGPGAAGCDTTSGNVDADPWLVFDLTGPSSVSYPSTAAYTASVDQLSGPGFIVGTFPNPDVTFGATSGSMISPVPITSGEATSTFTPPASNGPVTLLATLDNQTVTLDVNVTGAPLVPTRVTASPMVLDAIPLLRITIGGVEARLTHAVTGAPIAGEPIVFTAGTTHLCTAITNSNGYAGCTLTLVGNLAGILNLGFNATYLGDANHLPSGGAAGRGPLLKVGPLRIL
jgi:hypothetical protein